MAELQNKNKDFLERRRQLLKLGAAGVPMVLTLKASATQPVHSALDCAFVIPTQTNILVDHEGRAWVGDGNIKKKNGKLKVSDIEAFKQNASYVFPEGSAPLKFRPDECPEEDNSCGGDDDDDWSAKDRGSLWGNMGQDDLLVAAYGGGDDDDWRDDDGGFGSCGSGDDDDDDDDDGGDGDWTDCGYKFKKISSNTTITPSDYLNENGSWQLNGKKGLYLALAGKYLDTYGNDGGFPGISCLLSILNYLEMQ